MSFLCPFPFYHSLGAMYTVHLWLVGKHVVDFPLALIELFRQLSPLMRYERILVKIVTFERGWVTLTASFRKKGGAHQRLLAPQFLKFALKVTHRYPLIALIGSLPRAFQRAIDEPCTLPLSPPKRGTKRDFAVFSSKIQLLLKEVYYKVSFCENVQRQSYIYIIPLSNGP